MNLKEKYVNPLTDFGFKKLFGSEPNKEFLIDFLNQLLPKHHQIKQLNYTKNEQLAGDEASRKAIYDLFCESETGEKFIVELQKVRQNFFKDRSVYYSTFPIQEQAIKGNWDFELTPVYTIGVLDFIFDEHKNEEELLHNVKLKDQNGRIFYDKLTYIYIELPKFKKTEEELTTKFEKWLYVFRHLAKLQERPKALQERVFDKLFEAAEIAKFTPTERQNYEDSLKYSRDLKNSFDAKIEEGRKKGRKEGLKEGKLEEKLEIARNLKVDGLDYNLITKYTGLSKEEIEKL